MTTTHEPTPAAVSSGIAPGSHLADPAPLGLAAFALTTFVLSFVNTGIFKAEPVVFGLALAYGGVAQFAAGMWEFAKGNTFGATAFSSYGAFWLSFWYLTGHTDMGSLQAGDIDKTVGLYLIAWGIFTGYMSIGATRVSGAVLTVFVLLTITYLVLGIGDLTGTAGIGKVGGWIGIATALAAWYASFAGVTAFTHKRAMVPTGPRE
jgi:succinate-acetate transporter protein